LSSGCAVVIAQGLDQDLLLAETLGQPRGVEHLLAGGGGAGGQGEAQLQGRRGSAAVAASPSTVRTSASTSQRAMRDLRCEA
jgi:hypothetical protein